MLADWVTDDELACKHEKKWRVVIWLALKTI